MSPGEITLGIGLSFISVALGVLSLVVKSECEEVSICWGCLQCTKNKGKKRQRENNTKEPEEEEEVAEKMLPSSVAIGLKGFVVAGTMYALVDLFTGPKIEQEVRRGDEAEGERVCARARHTACFLRSVHVRDIHIQVVATALFFLQCRCARTCKCAQTGAPSHGNTRIVRICACSHRAHVQRQEAIRKFVGESVAADTDTPSTP